MDRYPRLIFTCDGDGIYVLGAGPNPMAEIRRLDTGEVVGPGPMQLMSIVAHIDLSEWEEVPGADSTPQPDAFPLSEEDRRSIQQQIRSLLIARGDELRERCGDGREPVRVLALLFDRSNWESMALPDQLDQGFRHLTRESQLALLQPVLAELRRS